MALVNINYHLISILIMQKKKQHTGILMQSMFNSGKATVFLDKRKTWDSFMIWDFGVKNIKFVDINQNSFM